MAFLIIDIFIMFLVIIAGLAIFGNWLPSPTRESFFPAGANFRYAFGDDVMAYFPSRIDARYEELQVEILETSGFPHTDLLLLRRFYREATAVYEEAWEKVLHWREAAQTHASPSRPREPLKPAGWRAVLGLSANETDVKAVKHAFRTRVKKAYPDFGGSDEEAASVIKAYKQAKAELSFA